MLVITGMMSMTSCFRNKKQIMALYLIAKEYDKSLSS